MHYGYYVIIHHIQLMWRAYCISAPFGPSAWLIDFTFLSHPTTHIHTHTQCNTHKHSQKLTAFQRIWRNFNTIKSENATSYTLLETCINMHIHTHSALQLWRRPSGDGVCPILSFYLGQPHTEVCTPLFPLRPSLLLFFFLLCPNICLHSCLLSFCLLPYLFPFTLNSFCVFMCVRWLTEKSWPAVWRVFTLLPRDNVIFSGREK